MKKTIYQFSFLLLLLSMLFSCVSKRKYDDQLYENAILRKESSERLSNLAKQIEITLDLQKKLSKQVKLFDTTLNRILQTADDRVTEMNRRYQEKMLMQLAELKAEVSGRFRALFRDQIADGSVNVATNEGGVQLVLQIDSLYSKDSLTFNAKGLEVIRLLLSDGNLSKYRVTARNEITYKDSLGNVEKGVVSSSILGDFLERTEAANVSEEYKYREYPFIYNQYAGQNIRLNFIFGFEKLDAYYFNKIAIGGELFDKTYKNYVVENALASSGISSREISFRYKDDNNIKYLIYPSDYAILGFENALDKEVVKKLGVLSQKKFSSVVKVDGRDKIDFNCSTKRAVLVISRDNVVLRRYANRYINCDEIPFNLEK